jgi:L-arabinose isomerase
VPAYAYELRRGDQIVATGHMSQKVPLVAGEPIMIEGHHGIVRSVSSQMDAGEFRVVVQLMPNGTAAEAYIERSRELGVQDTWSSRLFS